MRVIQKTQQLGGLGPSCSVTPQNKKPFPILKIWRFLSSEQWSPQFAAIRAHFSRNATS